VRVFADAGPKIDVTGTEIRVNDKRVGAPRKLAAVLPALRAALRARLPVASADPLVIPVAVIRAEPAVPAALIASLARDLDEAGFPHLGFQSERAGAWTYAYLPRLPSAIAGAPPPRPVLAVELQKGAIRVGDTTGKRWFIADIAGARNFGTLADILRSQRQKPTYRQRSDLELSAAAGITYVDLADAMNLV
jgi:hypothetical protein